MTTIRDDLTIDQLLRQAAQKRPDDEYLVYGAQRLGVADLHRQVDELAAGLAAAGIRRGDRVPVMLDNHPEHVLVLFALIRIGAVQVPVNTRLAGASLAYLLEHCEPARVIADLAYAEVLREALPAGYGGGIIWREPAGITHAGVDVSLADLMPAGGRPAPLPHQASDIIAILYTSGTTGPPKGVLVTDKMLRAAAWACAQVSAARDGEVFYMWEPLYHVGGSQVLVLALEHAVRLWMTPRFSATRFWDEVRACGATRIHFLGGILQMLLRQPPSPLDREHRVTIAYGGGAPAAVWQEFEQRFGVQVRESYGMTECASFTCINTDGRHASVGRPPPYFDVRIVDPQGRECGAGERGEFVVRALEAGVITPGYFHNPEASARALRDGAMHTGDLGWFDDEGYYYYGGRTKDSVRRRGENVSCWEIERVVDQMPEVEESAVVGVPDELGDETIKIYVRAADGVALEPSAVFRWCERHLARFQVPEYLEVIAAFDKTGTQRIRKETLARNANGWRWRAGAVEPA